MNTYDIFISYRRTNSKGEEEATSIARGIQKALELEGYRDRVFFDYSEIKDGEFEKVIFPAIEKCKVFLLVLTPESMQRCVNKRDWVRREALHAKKHNLKIIPINYNGIFSDECYPKGFPQEMNFIKKEQHSIIHKDSSYERDIQAMIEDRIAPITAPTKHTVLSTSNDGTIIHIETDLDCEIFDYNRKIGNAKQEKDNTICLRKGTHKLEFRSVENAQDIFSQIYTVEDNQMENYLPVKLIPIKERREGKIIYKILQTDYKRGNYSWYLAKATSKVIPQKDKDDLYAIISRAKFAEFIGNEVYKLKDKLMDKTEIFLLVFMTIVLILFFGNIILSTYYPVLATIFLKIIFIIIGIFFLVICPILYFWGHTINLKIAHKLIKKKYKKYKE